MSSFLLVIMHSQDIVAILAPLSLVVFCLMYIQQITFPRKLPKEIAIVFVLIVYLCVNIVMNKCLAGADIIQFMKSYGKIFYSLGLFIVFFLFRPTARIERSLYPASIIAGCVVASITLYSYVTGPISLGFFELRSTTQMSGLLGGHNVTADSLGNQLVIFMIAYLTIKRGNEYSPLKPGFMYGSMTFIIAVTFALAKSRGVSAGVLTACGFMCLMTLWRDRHNLLNYLNLSRTSLVIGIVLLLMTGGVFFVLQSRLEGLEQDPNVLIRLALWARAVRYFLTSPLSGLGLGSFEQTNVRVYSLIPGLISIKSSGTYLPNVIGQNIEGGMHAHNVYLQILAELGLIGLGLFLLMIIVPMFRRIPEPSAAGAETDADFEYVRGAAEFNRYAVIFLFIRLAVGGMTGGYTLTSPTAAWALYVAMGRLVRQHMYLTARPASRSP